MTAPTKGMVAGKPIQTGAQTKEFDEGFERTFGERKPARGRFVYTQGGAPLEAPVQVGEEWKQPDSGPSCKSEAEVYGNLSPSTDGKPLDSRTKHRNYMKDTGTTMASDYSETWAKAKAEREKVYSGTHDVTETRAALERAIHEARRRK